MESEVKHLETKLSNKLDASQKSVFTMVDKVARDIQEAQKTSSSCQLCKNRQNGQNILSAAHEQRKGEKDCSLLSLKLEKKHYLYKFKFSLEQLKNGFLTTFCLKVIFFIKFFCS